MEELKALEINLVLIEPLKAQMKLTFLSLKDREAGKTKPLKDKLAEVKKKLPGRALGARRLKGIYL